MDVCPVFKLFNREQYSPKAKQILLRKGWADDGLLDWKKMLFLAGHCTSCERCKAVCAVGLSVPQALADARAKHPQWQQYAWREWIDRGKHLWPIASRMAPLIPQGILPENMATLHASALAMKTPPPLAPIIRLQASHPKTLHGKKIVLFGGCTATRLRPAWIKTAQNILHQLGARTVSTDLFTCCGGTHEHAGMFDASHKAAKHNVHVWKELGKPAIATFCASCSHSLRHYPHLPNVLTQEEATQWTAALTPLSTLLQAEHTQSLHQEEQGALSYHSPCHWGKADADLQWLQKVLPHMRKGTFPCCGFGGILKMLNPKLSKNMVEACWQGLTSQNTNTVLTGCSGCTMQLNAHAPHSNTVYHWLDAMDCVETKAAV